MTKRITVSLPDEIAERVEQEKNASAFVAHAIEREISAERTRDYFEAHGIAITDEGVARWRRKLQELDQIHTPQRRRALRDLVRREALGEGPA